MECNMRSQWQWYEALPNALEDSSQAYDHLSISKMKFKSHPFNHQPHQH